MTTTKSTNGSKKPREKEDILAVKPHRKKARGMKFTRGEIRIVAGLSIFTVIVFFAGSLGSGGIWDYIQFVYMLLIPLWIALPMWLAGQHQGWGSLDRPWQEDDERRTIDKDI